MQQSKFAGARSPRGTWVIAHRGASGRYPENSMAAFRAAAKAGADLIELDVHLSADGQVVVMHDDKLGRTCSGSGKLSELPWQYIESQDAGSWKSERFAGERVPTLGLVLAEIALPVMCDIKREDRAIVQAAAEAIHGAGAADRVIVASSSDANLAWARDLLPDCERLALRRPDAERGAHIVGPHVEEIDSGVVARAHGRGRAVWAWTADEPRDISAMINLGVDGIISNWPERTIEALSAPK